MHVALVGFMAAGNARIGRRLANEMQLPFVDTDAIVVARHGAIANIFARDGEAAFRAYECEAVRQALDGPSAVIALGGGAVTHAPTLLLLETRATRVYLDVPLAVLVMRLRTDKGIRPLAGTRPSEKKLRALLESRLPYYRDSEITVECGRRTSGAIAREIVARLAERSATVA